MSHRNEKENAMLPMTNDEAREARYAMERSELRRSMADGLRALAARIESEESLPVTEWDTINVQLWVQGEDFQEAVRALGPGVKSADEYSMTVGRWFSPLVRLAVQTGRSEVCERKVVGTKIKVERRLPDEAKEEAERLTAQLAALEVEVEREEEVVEWDCGPLLQSVREPAEVMEQQA